MVFINSHSKNKKAGEARGIRNFRTATFVQGKKGEKKIILGAFLLMHSYSRGVKKELFSGVRKKSIRLSREGLARGRWTFQGINFCFLLAGQSQRPADGIRLMCWVGAAGPGPSLSRGKCGQSITHGAGSRGMMNPGGL